MKILILMTKYYPGFVIRILAKIFQNQILKMKIFNFVRGHHHFILEDTKVSFEHIHFYAKILLILHLQT
jgi:hypothetical protein